MPGVTTNKKLIRITTVPMALRYLLPGQMQFMSANGFDVLMISADGKELTDVIKNESCRHIIVPLTRKITPFQDIKCLFKLISIFRIEKPDIVHSHTPKAGLLGMLAAKISGVKTRIHTVAGLPLMVEKGFRYRLLKLTEKITYSAANQVWPNSGSLLKYIKDHNLTSLQKLNIIGKGSTNGINLARFNAINLDEKKLQDIKTVLHFSGQNKYLLFTGRLVADKGIIELVNVFVKIQKTQPGIQLILVGDFENALDPLPVTTMTEIESNRGIIHVNWTNDVEYYMQLADIFVFPSKREGFPNVLLQAGAMELPVICSRISGNKDIVTDNITGLIFENGNEDQMMVKIEYALANPLTLQTLAKQLKQKVIEDYNQENIWQNILTTYKSLVN